MSTFIHTRGSLLSKMLLVATQAHTTQFDKGGNPYILHPLKVMHYLGADAHEELQCIALGHDLLEDTLVTAKYLYEMGFTDRIVEGIRALTKIPGESYDDYKAKVFANRDAVMVKMADLRHNSDLRRLKGVTEKDLNRLQRYVKFYHELSIVLSQNI